MHRPICDFFFHHRNTGIGRFQYLGIDRIIWGAGAISKLLLSCPLSEAAPTPLCMRCMVFLFPFVSSNLPATPTHTPQRGSAYSGNVIDNVHVQYCIAAVTEKMEICLELATAITKINKTGKINLPATGNTHPPCLESHKI